MCGDGFKLAQDIGHGLLNMLVIHVDTTGRVLHILVKAGGRCAAGGLPLV